MRLCIQFLILVTALATAGAAHASVVFEFLGTVTRSELQHTTFIPPGPSAVSDSVRFRILVPDRFATPGAHCDVFTGQRCILDATGLRSTLFSYFDTYYTVSADGTGFSDISLVNLGPNEFDLRVDEKSFVAQAQGCLTGPCTSVLLQFGTGTWRRIDGPLTFVSEPIGLAALGGGGLLALGVVRRRRAPLTSAAV